MSARSESGDLAWYSDALDVLNPLRWHLNELLDEMEAHNRYAKRVGAALLPESKIQEARKANLLVDEFFGASTGTKTISIP